MLGIFGYSPRRIVLGFMISTALMSVIMSTTVVLIMLPIAFVVLRDLSTHHIAIGTRFRTTPLLGIAYSSSIGSVATLIGAPPNLLYAGTVSEIFNHNTTFVEWSSLGAPLSITMLLITCFYLLKVLDKEKIIPINDNTNNTMGYSDTMNSKSKNDGDDKKKAKAQQKKRPQYERIVIIMIYDTFHQPLRMNLKR
jgi:di/tricarboxylate transporter